MFDFTSQANLYIQAFIGVILVGVFYSIWTGTKAYGGLIGMAIRLFGLGMLFITVSVLERILINFNIVGNTSTLAMVQDILSVMGLAFLGLGFSKLSAVNKV